MTFLSVQADPFFAGVVVIVFAVCLVAAYIVSRFMERNES